MVEWSDSKSSELENLLLDAIWFANAGNRNAYKCIQSLKPKIDIALEKWAMQAKQSKGPAK